jgi:hypothetical protein
MTKSRQIAQLEGIAAAKAGQPHTAHNYHRPEQLPEAISWAHAWLITRVQIETGLIILPTVDGSTPPAP